MQALHGLLTAGGCEMEIKPAKSGPLVSYKLHKLSVCNFITRKKGIHIRIYGNHVGAYEAFLQTLPQSMRKTIVKASVCRRLMEIITPRLIQFKERSDLRF